MVLTSGDKAECKEIAREIIKEVLIEHIKSCPHGVSLARDRVLLLGVCIGSGIGGGGLAAGVIGLLFK